MNRLKKIALNVVLVAGMSMMAIPGFAQQETDPDLFMASGETSPAQPVAQQKHKDKVEVASSKQPKARNHKQDAKANKSDKQLLASARK